jgi:hypothetical protein
MLVGSVVANKVDEVRSKASVSTAGTDDEFLKELSGFLIQIAGRVAVEVATRNNVSSQAGCAIKWDGFTSRDEDGDQFVVE